MEEARGLERASRRGTGALSCCAVNAYCAQNGGEAPRLAYFAEAGFPDQPRQRSRGVLPGNLEAVEQPDKHEARRRQRIAGLAPVGQTPASGCARASWTVSVPVPHPRSSSRAPARARTWSTSARLKALSRTVARTSGSYSRVSARKRSAGMKSVKARGAGNEHRTRVSAKVWPRFAAKLPPHSLLTSPARSW